MKKRTPRNLVWEYRLGHPSSLIVGVDEVGRGCLAGPVVAAAFALPGVIDFKAEPWLKEVTDSKCLRAEVRERLAPELARWALGWALGSASVEEIDQINIYHASHLAMCRAVTLLEEQLRTLQNAAIISHILIDGNVIPKALKWPATPVIKGDFHCLSIGAASILAKVSRDREMAELEATYPGYGFAAHKGYGTPEHTRALKERGACQIHRRSFAPVAAALAAAGARAGDRGTGAPDECAFAPDPLA